MAQAALASRAKSPEAFRTISEVADELDVPQHVLRFWEGRFAQIRPVKRAGGRRYYRPEDVDLLRGIRALLYTEGFTIKGVQKVLRDRGLRHVMAIGQGQTHAPVAAPVAPPPAPMVVPVAETRVTPFRPRVVKPKAEAPRLPDLFMDLPQQSPPEQMVAEIERAYAPELQPEIEPAYTPELQPEPQAQTEQRLSGEERHRLEAFLAELLELKARLRNRSNRG